LSELGQEEGANPAAKKPAEDVEEFGRYRGGNQGDWKRKKRRAEKKKYRGGRNAGPDVQCPKLAEEKAGGLREERGTSLPYNPARSWKKKEKKYEKRGSGKLKVEGRAIKRGWRGHGRRRGGKKSATLAQVLLKGMERRKGGVRGKT